MKASGSTGSADRGAQERTVPTAAANACGRCTTSSIWRRVTASSIRKTFTSRLDLWLNPMLDAATSGNDFDLRTLRSQPMSIYVGVNPEDLHACAPVLSLFFQQAIGLQTRELPEHNPRSSTR